MSRTIEEWVAEAEGNPEDYQLRQAVHTVLHAVSDSEHLRGRMLIKGGMLLAIHYGSDRFTRDVDFSTTETTREFDKATFLDSLSTALSDAVETLDYQLDCRVQSSKMKPPRPDDSFPTLTIKIAHAHLGSSDHRHLAKGSGHTLLSLDYSLNEHQLFDADIIYVGRTASVQAYSLPDLIGEKFRAMLQSEARDRSRGQDIYDVHQLLADVGLGVEENDELRVQVLHSLTSKSASRSLAVNSESLDREEISNRLRESYQSRLPEIEPNSPPFDIAYERVRQYYVSLPWQP